MGEPNDSVPASGRGTTPLASSGDRPVPPISGSSQKVYPPRQGKTLRMAGLFVGFALLAAVSLASDITRWAHGGTAPAPGSVLVGISILFFLGLGSLSLVGALRGLPRLTLTAAGVRLETVFGTRWASWGSLEPFREATLYRGRFNRRVTAARSAVVGAEASAGVRRKKLLDVPDAFIVSIDDIIADLNGWRARVLGVAPTLRWAIRSDEDERKFGVPGFKAPWLTIGILTTLCLAFVLEQIYALGPVGAAFRPSTATLMALGALNRSIMVSTGEWYRLFTAPMLHLDLAHLLLNSLAFLMIGTLLERLVGRAWFLAFFVIGALGGSALSLALNPASTTSVGASGAIMGLFGAAFVGSYRVPLGTLTRQLSSHARFKCSSPP